MHPQKMYASKSLCIPSSTPKLYAPWIVDLIIEYAYQETKKIGEAFFCGEWILKDKKTWGNISLARVCISKEKELWKWKSCVVCILQNKKIQGQSNYEVCTLKDKELNNPMLYMHIRRQKTCMLLQETFPRICGHSIQQKQKDLRGWIWGGGMKYK